MKVRALIRFEDYKENVMRNVGDVFEVTEERHEEILTKGGLWVEAIEEQGTEPETEQGTKSETEQGTKSGTEQGTKSGTEPEPVEEPTKETTKPKATKKGKA